jgi:hypothetical protein
MAITAENIRFWENSGHPADQFVVLIPHSELRVMPIQLSSGMEYKLYQIAARRKFTGFRFIAE